MKVVNKDLLVEQIRYAIRRWSTDVVRDTYNARGMVRAYEHVLSLLDEMPEYLIEEDDGK